MAQSLNLRFNQVIELVWVKGAGRLMLVLGRVKPNKLIASLSLSFLFVLVEPAPEILGLSLDLVSRAPGGHCYLGASLQ